MHLEFYMTSDDMKSDIHNIPSVDSDSHGILSLSPVVTLHHPSPHEDKDSCASETEAETGRLAPLGFRRSPHPRSSWSG